VGVGIVQHTGGSTIGTPPVASVDLSNYYTKTQLSGYHSARVHWTNIVYDGKLAAYMCLGEATVNGVLGSTAVQLARGLIEGTTIVTGTGRTFSDVLKGSISGSATVLGATRNSLLGLENLTAPAGDRILFYDYSAGYITWLTAGTGLTISGTTLNSSGSSYTFQYSIEEDSSANVNLVGDVDSPGSNKLYGTNGSGTRGWYDQPAGGGVDVSGTPVDNQITIWVDLNTLEGTTGLTYNGTTVAITGSVTPTTGVYTDNIYERSSGVGVNIDTSLIKDAKLYPYYNYTAYITADSGNDLMLYADGGLRIDITSGAITCYSSVLPSGSVGFGSAVAYWAYAYFDIMISTGYYEITEMAAPSTPDANKGRLYVADDSGTTKLYFKTSTDIYDLTEAGSYYIPWGTKTSTSSAGTVGEQSIDDDYLYICVATGGAGAATWKKVALMQSP
jgi:hypothetical protein